MIKENLKLMVAGLLLMTFSCNVEKVQKNELNVEVKRKNDYYNLMITFNLSLNNNSLYYDEASFQGLFGMEESYNKNLNSGSWDQQIKKFPKVNRFVLENDKGQRRFLLLNYEIFHEKRVIVLRNFSVNDIHYIKYPESNSYMIKQEVFNLDDLKVNKSDKRIRIYYVSGRNSKIKKNIWVSNWIILNNDM